MQNINETLLPVCQFISQKTCVMLSVITMTPNFKIQKKYKHDIVESWKLYKDVINHRNKCNSIGIGGCNYQQLEKNDLGLFCIFFLFLTMERKKYTIPLSIGIILRSIGPILTLGFLNKCFFLNTECISVLQTCELFVIFSPLDGLFSLASEDQWLCAVVTM